MIFRHFSILTLLLVVALSSLQAQRIYVDSASVVVNPDGSSWAQAFPDLQSAIDTAHAGDSIWVARGTYFPTVEVDTDTSGGSDTREKTFYISKDSIKIFGGFAVNDSLFSQRNIRNNPTVLSGEEGDSLKTNDNLYHVVFIDGTTVNGSISRETVIDGFTVANGLSQSQFILEPLPNIGGGGIHIFGAAFGAESSPTISNCTFLQNAARWGGAIGVNGYQGKSAPVIINCHFRFNLSQVGSAICNFGQSGEASPQVVNCTFFTNGSGSGGTIHNFASNSGIVDIDIISCTVAKNILDPGAAISSSSSPPSSCKVNVSNSIIWNNTNLRDSDSTSFDVQIFGSGNVQTQISHSVISGIGDLTNPPASWVQNYDFDPYLVDPFLGDFRLETGSRAVNLGINDSIPSFVNGDFQGNPRIQDSTVDIGAFEGETFVPRRIYVDSASSAITPDGRSWATAFQDLQDGLDTAKVGDTIWVAQGTYFPSIEFDADTSGGTDPRERTFYLNRDSIKIYGGFQGNEGLISQRQIGVYPSILSGDVGVLGDRSDNVYHILFVDGTTPQGNITPATRIDGFTLTQGNANDSFPNNSGGGIFIMGQGNGNEASPTIANCEFTHNQAAFGGGVYNNGSASGNGSPSFANCLFMRNQATHSGGAMSNFGRFGTSDPAFIKCTFIQNKAKNIGGMMFNYAESGNSSPAFTNCTFERNQADIGGALYNFGPFGGNSSPALVNCLFSQNEAFLLAGAIYNGGASSGTSSPSLVNCTFSQNRAAVGAAMYNDNFFSGTSSPSLTNCILWENKAGRDSTSFSAQIFQGASSQVQIVHSIVNGIDTLSNKPATWTNNLALAPLFVNADAGDLRLKTGSPAIDVGSNDSIPIGITSDLAGNARIQNTSVDMGAFEGGILILTRFYVDSASTAANPDGSSWANAFPEVEDALQLVGTNDTIWVAKGTYFPLTEFDADSSGGSDPRERALYLNKEGVKMYGGFQGNETLISQRDIDANPTILSGDIGIQGDNSDNAFHVLIIDGTSVQGTISASTIIDGFQVSGGNADVFPIINLGGGGILLNGQGAGNEASPTIRNCTFTQNEAVLGGAIISNGRNKGTCSPTIDSCTFLHNSADNGAAVYNDGTSAGRSDPIFTNCSFERNTASTLGGAIHNESPNAGFSSPVITSCTFVQNSAGKEAGAIYNNGTSNGTCSPILTNCLFVKNEAQEIGGAIYNVGQFDGVSFPSIINCSFSQNAAGNSGGGIANLGGVGGLCEPEITNTIVWGNRVGPDSASFQSQLSEGGNSQSTVTYSLVNGIDTLTNRPPSWTNNLALNPLFTRPDFNDFRLLVTSPAINAGDNNALPAGIITDLAGNPRIEGATVDMGAFEGGVPVAIDPATSPLAALKVYPNPVMDQLHLEWEVKPSEIQGGQNFTAELYDLQGRNIRTYSLPATASKHTIECSDLPTGIYTLRVAGWGVRVIKR